jgi:hypothetical protein
MIAVGRASAHWWVAAALATRPLLRSFSSADRESYGSCFPRATRISLARPKVSECADTRDEGTLPAHSSGAVRASGDRQVPDQSERCSCFDVGAVFSPDAEDAVAFVP